MRSALRTKLALFDETDQALNVYNSTSESTASRSTKRFVAAPRVAKTLDSPASTPAICIVANCAETRLSSPFFSLSRFRRAGYPAGFDSIKRKGVTQMDCRGGLRSRRIMQEDWVEARGCLQTFLEPVSLVVSVITGVDSIGRGTGEGRGHKRFACHGG